MAIEMDYHPSRDIKPGYRRVKGTMAGRVDSSYNCSSLDAAISLITRQAEALKANYIYSIRIRAMGGSWSVSATACTIERIPA